MLLNKKIIKKFHQKNLKFLGMGRPNNLYNMTDINFR